MRRAGKDTQHAFGNASAFVPMVVPDYLKDNSFTIDWLHLSLLLCFTFHPICPATPLIRCPATRAGPRRSWRRRPQFRMMGSLTNITEKNFQYGPEAQAEMYSGRQVHTQGRMQASSKVRLLLVSQLLLLKETC